MATQKTHWLGYAIALIFSFLVLIVLDGTLCLAASFFQLPNFAIIYVLISIFSLAIGSIVALILNWITRSNKAFLIGCSVVSFLTAAVISISLSILNSVSELLQASAPTGIRPPLLFSKAPDPILTGVLIILFFNVVPIIIFFRKQEKSMKDLLIYLYSFIIFLVLYFLVPFILLKALMP